MRTSKSLPELQAGRLATVPTSEELRVSALAASAKRGRWVAQRRIFMRWLGWLLWSIALPVIGLLTVFVALVGIFFWQYQGHDAAYVAAQNWVQQEFGTFQNTKTIDAVQADKTSMISLTLEATPNLILERQLKSKVIPSSNDLK